MKWEYKVAPANSLTPSIHQRDLNTHGDQEWELVTIIIIDGNPVFYMKKAKGKKD